MRLTMVPYLGKDFKKKQEVIDHLVNGGDLLTQDMSSRWDGKPGNLDDLVKGGVTTLNVHYKGLRQVAVLDTGKLLKLREARRAEHQAEVQ